MSNERANLVEEHHPCRDGEEDEEAAKRDHTGCYHGQQRDRPDAACGFHPQPLAAELAFGLRPAELAVAMSEGWRGEIVHVAITDERGRIRRHKVVDPSFHNWPALAAVMPGNQISDFPLCNKSFNLSYAGHDL